MKVDLSKRLSYRLTRNTVLSALALGIVLNLGVVTLDYFNAKRDMDAEINALMEVSHSPASQIAYNIDTRLAEELLEGLLRHPGIIMGRLEDPDGRVLAERERTPRAAPYRWLSDRLFGPRRHYETDLQVRQLEDMDLGRLAITVDTYHSGTAFLERATHTLVSGFIKSLTLAGLLLFIFYFMITKPLIKVISGLADVDAEKAEKARLPTPPRHEEDEIGLLVRMTNNHLDTIDSSLQRLRQAEGSLKEYNDRLSQIVEARTGEIRDKNEALQRSNRALINAREEALETARARADFLASMSHEIRTPLNGLLGMLRLVLEGQLPADQRNRMEIALSAGENLLNLVNDILDISKVEAGKLSLEDIAFDLGSLAEECATLFAEQGQRSHIDIVTRIAPDLPPQFRGDPTRIRQIINNLLGNAIKFTNHGRVELFVEQGRGGVLIQVQDTGIGMSRQAQDAIFSPFSQGHTDTTRRFGGTGLGLTLCRQLVERMQGDIRVASEEDQGTLFTVRLPLNAIEDASERPGENDLFDMTVALLASPTNAHIAALKRYLEFWDTRIKHHTYPPQEPEQLSLSECDLIVVDVREPRWLTLLAQCPKRPPVVTLDRNDTEPPCPVAGVIELPINRRQLVNLLRTATGLQPLHSESGQVLEASSEPLTILLVEDNRVNQLVASGMVRKLGHSVDLAENGERALEALRNRRYDLVLMDCQMPVMDGFEATRQARREPGLQSVPIIAVTANVMQGDREDCLAAGMDDYLTKPYTLEAMRDVIARWAGSVHR